MPKSLHTPGLPMGIRTTIDVLRNPTCSAILRTLSVEGPQRALQIARKLGIRYERIYTHLHALEDAGFAIRDRPEVRPLWSIDADKVRTEFSAWGNWITGQDARNPNKVDTTTTNTSIRRLPNGTRRHPVRVGWMIAADRKRRVEQFAANAGVSTAVFVERLIDNLDAEAGDNDLPSWWPKANPIERTFSDEM